MMDMAIIIFIFISIGFVVTIELMIKKGKLKRINTYSYKPVVNISLIALYVVIIICLLVYIFSKSAEVTLTLGSFLLFCVIAGCLKGLLSEYQTKRRGGRKE
jgi:hypothetical protein